MKTCLVLLAVVLCGVRSDDSDNGDNAWSYVLECAGHPETATCIEERGVQALKGWMEPSTGRGSNETPGFLEQISDLVMRLLGDGDEEAERETAEEELGIFNEDDDDQDKDESDKLLEEDRGKKKKKRKALVKLYMAGMLLKSKLGLMFNAISTFLQVKFFGLAIINLLLSLFRLYLELSKSKSPQKVIYYEHAQHQHHYDHEHHYDDEGHKGWSGLWSRSLTKDDKPDPNDVVYSAYRPRELS